MNFVIPMAGAGSRFRQAGFALPKPLINVFGKPMYSWAVKSLPLELCSRLIFICLEEHLEKYGLRADIESRYTKYSPEILALPCTTRGQAETVLMAKGYMTADKPLLIFNADSYIISDIGGTLKRMLHNNLDGIIQVFFSNDPRYSYAKTDSDGFVMETAEKVVISNNATTGLYVFNTAENYCYYAEKMINSAICVAGEYYVAPIYNDIIAKGGKIITDIAREVHILGTPEELAKFNIT